MIVRENISFERGKDPKRSMGISYQEELRNKFLDYFESREFSGNSFWIENGKLHYWSMSRKETEKFYVGKSGISEYLSLSQMRVGRENNYRKRFEIPIKKQYKGYLERFTNQPKSVIAESVSFERGKDPKEAVGIGVDYFTIKADYICLPEFWGSSKENKMKSILPDDEAIPALEQMEMDVFNQLQVVSGENYPDPPYDTHSFGYLKNQDQYKYIKYQGKYYKIPNRIKESFSFQRGKDPKEKMDIGDKDAQVITKLERVLSSLGFSRAPIDIEPESYLRDIAQWSGPNGVDINLYQNLDTDPSWNYGTSITFNNRKNILGEVKEEDFDKLWVWENILAG